MRPGLTRFLKILPPAEISPTGDESNFSADETTVQLIGHDPELTAHDDAIFLLHTAAEVEHSLMVQYLFAAYSLKTAGLPADKQALVNKWRGKIVSIATEEMGHLASVQNLLHLIGGPLNFEREDFPFRSGFYPFRFKLERLTKNSLAKYVYAEMPENLEGPDIDEIKNRAAEANMNDQVIHVGHLYKAIIALFERRNADGSYSLNDFVEGSENFQADESWRGSNFILNTVKTREDAILLLQNIARQGEGLEVTDDMMHSHYIRFREIYDAFPENGDWEPALNLASNPNTMYDAASTTELSDDADLATDLREGYISNGRTRLWAQLLNLRYRMLLLDISHALSLNNKTEPGKRQILQNWAFDEMFFSSNITIISEILTMLPLKEEEGGVSGGPPFEMPYTLNLPADDKSRWRIHQDAILASQMLIKKILDEAHPDADQTRYLNDLAARDEIALKMAKDPDGPPPVEVPIMNRFTEVKNILENAVGNMTIHAHGNFWRDKTRDQFIGYAFAGLKLIAENNGTFDENESNLIKALEGRAPFGSDIGTPGAIKRRMPAGRPPVPQDKIDIIRKWIRDGCPDDVQV